jgi:hypothetical protein
LTGPLEEGKHGMADDNHSYGFFKNGFTHLCAERANGDAFFMGWNGIETQVLLFLKEKSAPKIPPWMK